MIDAAQQKIEEGRAARNAGDLAGGLRGYEAAVVLLREMDAPLRLAHTVRHVADMQREACAMGPAKKNYAEALSLYRENPATGRLDLANTLRGYALMMEALGDRATARAMWAEAGELYHAVGVQAGIEEAARRVERLRQS
jgi:hypothetical protein